MPVVIHVLLRGCLFLLTLYNSEAIIVPHGIIWSWYTGRWWVGCYIWYSEEGTGRDRPLLIERCVLCRGKGGIGSGETLCHIYPARPITTVSLATNTYCMMDGHSSCAPRIVGLRVQFSGACEQSHWWPARHTAVGRLSSVVQAATNTERL